VVEIVCTSSTGKIGSDVGRMYPNTLLILVERVLRPVLGLLQKRLIVKWSVKSKLGVWR
jgi:hypothetical protein